MSGMFSFLLVTQHFLLVTKNLYSSRNISTGYATFVNVTQHLLLVTLLVTQALSLDLRYFTSFCFRPFLLECPSQEVRNAFAKILAFTFGSFIAHGGNVVKTFFHSIVNVCNDSGYNFR